MGRAIKQTIEWAALREYDPRQALPRNPRMAVGHSPPHSAKPSAPRPRHPSDARHGHRRWRLRDAWTP